MHEVGPKVFNIRFKGGKSGKLPVFGNMVTGDETWVYIYDPQMKNQYWSGIYHNTSPRLKKFKSQDLYKMA